MLSRKLVVLVSVALMAAMMMATAGVASAQECFTCGIGEQPPANGGGGNGGAPAPKLVSFSGGFPLGGAVVVSVDGVEGF